MKLVADNEFEVNKDEKQLSSRVKLHNWIMEDYIKCLKKNLNKSQ